MQRRLTMALAPAGADAPACSTRAPCAFCNSHVLCVGGELRHTCTLLCLLPTLLHEVGCLAPVFVMQQHVQPPAMLRAVPGAHTLLRECKHITWSACDSDQDRSEPFRAVQFQARGLLFAKVHMLRWAELQHILLFESFCSRCTTLK